MEENTIPYSVQKYVVNKLRQAFLEEGTYSKNVTFALSSETIEQINEISESNKNLEEKFSISGLPTTKSDIITNAIEAYYEGYFLAKNSLDLNSEKLSSNNEDDSSTNDSKVANMIIVSCNSYDSYKEIFLKNHEWYKVSMAPWRIKYLKYLAIYVGKPYSQILGYAEITGFEVLEDGKYKIKLGEPIELENPIGLPPYNYMGVRTRTYTTFKMFKKAKNVADLSYWWH